MVMISEGNGRQLVMTASEQVYEGFVYKTTTNAQTKITGKADKAVSIALKKGVDGNGNALVARSGQKYAFAIVGSGDVVLVASVASQTYAVGAAVYLDDSVDGQCTAVNSTSTLLGHYIGDGVTTTASNGDFIEVSLDAVNATTA